MPETVVVMITGHGSIDSSVRAMKDGAADYILKPLDNTTVLESVRRTMDRRPDLLQKIVFSKTEINLLKRNQLIARINKATVNILYDRIRFLKIGHY